MTSLTYQIFDHPKNDFPLDFFRTFTHFTQNNSTQHTFHIYNYIFLYLYIYIYVYIYLQGFNYIIFGPMSSTKNTFIPLRSCCLFCKITNNYFSKSLKDKNQPNHHNQRKFKHSLQRRQSNR